MRNATIFYPSHFRRKQTLAKQNSLRSTSIQIGNDSTFKSTIFTATGSAPGNSCLIFLLLYIMLDSISGLVSCAHTDSVESKKSLLVNT